jgi:signal peptidase I
MFRQVARFSFDLLKTLAVALLIVVPLRVFVAQPFFVRGSSMDPTFHNGDYLIIDELSYRFRSPKRGEVIVFRYPKDPTQFFIKRIIGLPGETVSGENGVITVERFGERIVLHEPYIASLTPDTFRITAGPNEYIVLGDNRGASADSRRWGVLPRDLIVGRVILTVWPPDAFSVFAAPTYE